VRGKFFTPRQGGSTMLFLVLIALIIGCSKTTAKSEEKAPTLVSVLAPPKPDIGKIPEVVVTTEGVRNLGPRIKWLIESHPAIAINTEMRKKLLTGDVILQVDQAVDGSYSALFMPGYRKSTNTYIGIVALNPVNIDNIRTREDALYFMAVLYHEYQHYQQFMADANKAMWTLNEGDAPPAGWCEHHFQVEYDAYYAEAVLASGWGDIPQERPLVRNFSSPADFRRTVAGNMLLTKVATNHPECVLVWKTLGGL